MAKPFRSPYFALRASKGTLGEGWRTRVRPIRTFACVQLKINLKPAYQQPLYQQLSEKAIQLRKLGMSNQQIANKLNTHRNTIKKACNYQNRHAYQVKSQKT